MEMPRVTQPMRAAMPTGFLGLLILVLAVEHYVRTNDRYFCNPPGWEWQWNSRAARREAPSCDILCFGDSLTKLGVLPRAVEARTGRRTYNLASSGSEPPGQYFLLRQALEAGSNPQAILVNFLPTLMTTEPRRHVELWPYILSLRECAELAWDERDLSFFTSMALARLVPTVRYRFPLRTCIKNVLNSVKNTAYSHTYITGRLWRVNRGAIPTPGRRGNLPVIPEWGKSYFGKWRCAKTNGIYILKFLELAQKKHIRVYWMLVPIEPDLAAWCERTGFEAEQTRFLRALQARFPNLVVVDGRSANYDPGVFWDRHHLEKQGAIAFSIELGNLLRHDLAQGSHSGRWIELPRYRAHVADFPIEEYDQSSVALGQGRTFR